jgi:CRISPR-associated protein Cmr6
MIALPKDTRAAVGEFGSRIENRSLLFQKVVLAKSWGHQVEVFHDGNRFNVLRACSDGGRLLEEDASASQRKARADISAGRDPAAAQYREKVARAMAQVKVEFPDLGKAQIKNANDLMRLIQQSYPNASRTVDAELGGRLLIHMAGGVQENAGMALDRCFGLPFIAGSAVKGLARSAALWDIKRETNPAERREKLRIALLAFGFIGQDIQGNGDFVWAAGAEIVREQASRISSEGSCKGILSFLPAYPTSEPKIVAEVLTPHPRAQAAAYGDGRLVPVFFPAVEKGSHFGFAVVATWRPEALESFAPLLDRVEKWLIEGLSSQGIGAKTGAGYGWFQVDPQAEERRRAAVLRAIEDQQTARKLADEAARNAADAAAQKATRLAAMTPEEREAEEIETQAKDIEKLSAELFAAYAKALSEKEPKQQRAFLKVLLSKEHKDTRKRWKDKKPEIWTSVVSVAQALNISLN